MNNLPFFSLIIPCRNEEKYISGCLKSIFSQNYPTEKFEVILVDGCSTDNTVEIASNFKKVKIFSNQKKIVPVSMNMGIRESSGDYIIRIDVHCEYPKNYIYLLITNSIKFSSDNIGTVIRTLPANDSSEAKAIAENNGGKVLGSITKKLDFLVLGDSRPTKGKIDQDKKLIITILLEQAWNKILNT